VFKALIGVYIMSLVQIKTKQSVSWAVLSQEKINEAVGKGWQMINGGQVDREPFIILVQP
jgi:hypothetical protein